MDSLEPTLSVKILPVRNKPSQQDKEIIMTKHPLGRSRIGKNRRGRLALATISAPRRAVILGAASAFLGLGLVAVAPPLAEAVSVGSTDFTFIKTSNTGTGRVEAHVVTAGSNYATPSMQTGTALPVADAANGLFQVGDGNLYFIKTRATGSGKVEVHVLSAASNYKTFTTHVATALPAADAANGQLQIYNGNLYFIKTRATGSGRVEVHVLSAASSFQTFTLHTATLFLTADATNGNFTFPWPTTAPSAATPGSAAVSWAVAIANANSHGYSQANRWGPDYDCSSLVISAWQNAGVPVKTKGATYTGNMYSVFTKTGFSDVTSSVNRSTGTGLRVGDVLLNSVNHTAMVSAVSGSSVMIVEASSNRGYPQTGDQTGTEIWVHSYYNYPWNYVLRMQ